MRSGSLLAEESPHNLLAIHSLHSLEDVFLKLCMKNDNENVGHPMNDPSTLGLSSTSNRTMNIYRGEDNPTFNGRFASDIETRVTRLPNADNTGEAHKGNHRTIAMVIYYFSYLLPLYMNCYRSEIVKVFGFRSILLVNPIESRSARFV